MLRPFAHPVACCCVRVLLGPEYLRKVWNRSNFLWNPWSLKRSATMLRSVCTAFPTLLRPRTRIRHSLQGLMFCILPTIHWRSQHCWELLHPFAHHCQHGGNNSQHCWLKSVGGCRIRLHVALQTDFYCDGWRWLKHCFVSLTDELEETFTLKEVQEKLENVTRGTWNPLFIEGVEDMEVEGVEKHLPSKASKEDIRHDFTFYTPSCRDVRVKVLHGF